MGSKSVSRFKGSFLGCTTIMYSVTYYKWSLVHLRRSHLLTHPVVWMSPHHKSFRQKSHWLNLQEGDQGQLYLCGKQWIILLFGVLGFKAMSWPVRKKIRLCHVWKDLIIKHKFPRSNNNTLKYFCQALPWRCKQGLDPHSQRMSQKQHIRQ